MYLVRKWLEEGLLLSVRYRVSVTARPDAGPPGLGDASNERRRDETIFLFLWTTTGEGTVDHGVD